MNTSLAIVLAAAVVMVAEAGTTRLNTDKENIKQNKSLQFAKIIQEDLRRNNDDYVILTSKVTVTQRAPQKAISKPLNQNPLKTNPSKPNLVTSKEPPPKPLTTKGVLLTDVTSNNVPQKPMPNRRNFFNIYNRPITHVTNNFYGALNGLENRAGNENREPVKKVRLDKLRELIMRGKDQLRKIARTADGHTSMNPFNLQIDSFEEMQRNLRAEAKDPVTNNMLAQMLKFSAATHVQPTLAIPQLPLMMGNVDSEFDSDGIRINNPERLHSPAPDLLDMAPGRGPNMQEKRLKGLLCQRVVLNLEGPRYNRNGVVITGLRKSKSKRRSPRPPFAARTKAPKYVLPRCCNCCKKSVLGCQ